LRDKEPKIDNPDDDENERKSEIRDNYNEMGELLSVIYHKCSAEIIPEFISQIYGKKILP
jgi:hypothetical protein